MSGSEQTPGVAGNIDPCEAVLDEARAIGGDLAYKHKRPSPQQVAQALVTGMGGYRIDPKTILIDPRVQLLCQQHGLREKHLRDALKAVRDSARQADRESSGIVVPKQRRAAGRDSGTGEGAANA